MRVFGFTPGHVQNPDLRSGSYFARKGGLIGFKVE
jgi:hypothetical protein